MLHPTFTGLGILTRARCPSILSSPSPSSLLTMGWGRGRPQILLKKKKKSSLIYNLIHNLQAIQPVILVPLDHFLFSYSSPCPTFVYPLLPVFGGFFCLFLFIFCFCFYFILLFVFPSSHLTLTSLDLVWFLTDEPESSLGASAASWWWWWWW